MGLFLPGDNRLRVVYDRDLAEKLGVNIAIILSRIIWSLEEKIAAEKTEFFKEGRWWMYDTRQDLANYSGLTDKQIKGVLQSLREMKIIETGQFDNQFGVRRNWFTVNTAILLDSIGTKSTDSPIGTKGTDVLVQKGPIHRYKRDQCIGTKGTNTSLLLRVKTKSLTENQTKNPSNVTSMTKAPRTRKPKSSNHTAEDLDIAKDWLAYAETEMPWRKKTTTWTIERFAEGLAKVRKGTDLNFDGLRAVLKFVSSHSFWASRACSPVELLKVTEKESGRRKIDSILSQMRPDSLRQKEKMRNWAPITEEELNNPFG